MKRGQGIRLRYEENFWFSDHDISNRIQKGKPAHRRFRPLANYWTLRRRLGPPKPSGTRNVLHAMARPLLFGLYGHCPLDRMDDPTQAHFRKLSQPVNPAWLLIGHAGARNIRNRWNRRWLLAHLARNRDGGGRIDQPDAHHSVYRRLADS